MSVGLILTAAAATVSMVLISPMVISVIKSVLKGKVRGKRSKVEKKGGLERRKPRELWNTVLFFPDLCPSAPDSATNQLLGYLTAAKVSIHLCIYLVSHPALAEIVQRKYNQGLLVQVVTDYDTYTAHNNWGVKAWKRSGIPVRMKATGTLMHHKFGVIDEEAVLTGSLNWTKQGLAINAENVMITTEKRIVDKYLEEFHAVWNLFASDDD